jgi:sugar lactone lactonase YvrE
MRNTWMTRAATVAITAGIALAIGTTTASATPTATTPAPSSVALPLTSYAHLVLDPLHRHIFISAGKGTTAILVTDYAGKTVATIGNEQGANGLALSPDGRTVYAALADGDAISAISTRTLSETARYATTVEPQYVTYTAGRVWFGYDDPANFTAGIGSINPWVSPAAVTLDATSDSWSIAPILAADRDGDLAAAEPVQSPAELATYDVSGGTARVLAPQKMLNVSPSAANTKDIAITPDGTDLVTASGAPYEQEVFSMADLSSVGQYTTASYPNSVAIAANGTVFAGVTFNYGPAVYVFAPGNPTAARSLSLPSAQPSAPDNLADAGLAITPDGHELFAVSTDLGGDTHPVLNIIPNP